MAPCIDTFFDPATYSFTYLVSDTLTRRAAIIDPVADYDSATGQVSSQTAQRLLKHIEQRELQVDWLLETHIHADHLSAGTWLRDRLNAPFAASAQVCALAGQQTAGQQTAGEQAAGEQTAGPKTAAVCVPGVPGKPFDRLLHDNDKLTLGELTINVLATPGHTPTCLTYVCGDAAFVGDAIFMPDFGTGRTDFPGGSARKLYRSIQRILQLPATTRLFIGHDYGHDSRAGYCGLTSVADQQSSNVHLVNHPTEDAFVRFREQRDAGLPMPRLAAVAVPFNVQARVSG